MISVLLMTIIIELDEIIILRINIGMVKYFYIYQNKVHVNDW